MATPKAGFGSFETRIGKEATYGVAPATIPNRLSDLSIIPSPDIEVDFFIPTGSTAPTVGSVTRDRAVGEVSGRQSFSGIGYVLSGMLGEPVTTTPDATTAPTVRQHVWTMTGLKTAAFASYAMDFGSTDWAVRVLGGLFNGLTLGVNRGSLDFSSSLWGKEFITGIGGASTPPFSATPTDIAAAVVRALDYEVFADSTWAALGTTKLLELYGAEIALGERTAPAEPVNRTRSSDGFVEVSEQEHTFNATVGCDATANTLIARLKSGGRTFFRAKATGDNLGGTNTYALTVDACVQHSAASAPQSSDNVATIPIDGRMVRDTVSGNVCKFTLVNTVTAY